MNLNKPSRDNVLQKLTSYREQIDRLVTNPNSPTNNDTKT